MRKNLISSFGASALAAAMSLYGCSMNSEYRPNRDASTGKDYSSDPQQWRHYSAPPQVEAQPEPKKDLGYVSIPKKMFDPEYRASLREGTKKDPEERHVRTIVYQSPEEQLREKIDFLEEIYWQPQLVVNHGSHRTGFKGSEKEGFQYMRMLARVSDEEEAWVFLQEADVWIEIGKNLTTEEAEESSRKGGTFMHAVKFAVQLDYDYVTKLLRTNQGVISKARTYHFHPETNEEELARKIFEPARLNGIEYTESQKNLIRFRYSVMDALPSPNELPGSIRSVAKINDFWRWLDSSDAVGSVYGTTIISVSDQGKKTVSALANSVFNKIVFDILEKVNTSSADLPEELCLEKPESENVKEFRKKTLQKICKDLSTEDFRLEFLAAER